MIDPIEATIAYLRTDTALGVLVADCIAGKHHYADEWAQGQTALTVRADGGTPDVYAPEHKVRLEIMCYASNAPAAMAVWKRLVGISRNTTRVMVGTTQGNALVYSFLPSSEPSQLYDEKLGMDVCLAFFEIMVAE